MKSRTLFVLLFSLLSLGASGRLQAQQLLYQTALPDATPVPFAGFSILRCQWAGFRFQIPNDTEITAIGAAMSGYAPEGFFVAIVPLSAPDALPEGGPGESTSDNGNSGKHLGNWEKAFSPHEVLAITHVPINAPVSEDLVFPLNATLPAGNYGVVLGFDLGDRADEPNLLLTGGYEQRPDASYFWWLCSIWRDGGTGLKCSVFGNPLP